MSKLTSGMNEKELNSVSDNNLEGVTGGAYDCADYNGYNIGDTVKLKNYACGLCGASQPTAKITNKYSKYYTEYELEVNCNCEVKPKIKTDDVNSNLQPRQFELVTQ